MTTPFVDDLTRQQYEIVQFVHDYRARNDGLSPSYDEIGEALGICHRSNVRQKLMRLIAKGYIDQKSGAPRSLRTTEKWELRRRQKFGAAANPIVMEVVLEHPDVFSGWKAEQFDRLLSRRAFGGELTAEGVLHEAKRMQQNDTALADCRALLEVDGARDEILKLIESLKEAHTPRKRNSRRSPRGG